MRFVICLMVTLISFSGCKKVVEQKQEDLLLNLVVNGQWVVKKYTINSSSITSAFSPYRFQFKKDYTVDAINNGAVENTGTWSGNVTSRTITSNFPNPNATLAMLNGTWQVTDSGVDYVEGTEMVNGETRFLRLEKN